MESPSVLGRVIGAISGKSPAVRKKRFSKPVDSDEEELANNPDDESKSSEGLYKYYGRWIEGYMQNLQEQNELFEKLMGQYQQQLEQGIIPLKLDNGLTLLDLVKDGIPPKYRSFMWQIFTGTKQVIEACPGIFQQVLNDHTDQESEAILQIDKDIERTFPGSIGSFSREALRRVLVAYSWKNPQIGYCQSMNFICAGLLIFMSEEEAFWMLGYIAEKLLAGYFNEGLTGSRVDTVVLSHYLKKRISKLFKHFEQIGLELSLMSTHWFMCMFTTSVPNETAFRMWDYMFYLGAQGPKCLFEMALAILKLNEKALMKITDVPDTILFLNQQVTKIFDCSQLFEVGLKPLDGSKVLNMREQLKQSIENEAKEKLKMNRLQQLSEQTKFSINELEELYNAVVGRVGVTVVVPGLSKVHKIPTETNLGEEWGRDDTPFLRELFLHGFAAANGFIQFATLMNGLSCLCKGKIEDKLQMCFKVFATSEKDYIDKSRLQYMLEIIYRLYAQQNNEEEVQFYVQMIFSKAVNEKLKLEEFQELCLTQPLIRQCFQLENPKLERPLEIATLSRAVQNT